jgi:hypothetical protein
MERRRWTRAFHNAAVPLLTLLLCASLAQSASDGQSRISVEPDGGYSGIVVKVGDDVSEDHCAVIIANLQVRKNSFPSFDPILRVNFQLLQLAQRQARMFSHEYRKTLLLL